MKNVKKLQIEQLDGKLAIYSSLPEIPAKGWVHGIRTALKMSFRQLGVRLGITAQSVQEIEHREVNGNITLNNLREVATALDMKLVYGFVPRDGSFEKMLETQARIEKSVRELAEEIKREMPRYLWD